jgi:hypothetical protein
VVEIHLVLPATQYHATSPMGVISETNHCSLGPPLTDMDVQERRWPRKRQWTDITLQGGGIHKENRRSMKKAPRTTGSDEGLPAMAF